MNVKKDLSIMRIKTMLVLGGILVLWGALVWRLYGLQVQDSRDLIEKAERQYNSLRKVAPRRGRILDKNNNTFAVSLKVKSLYCVPFEIDNLWGVADKLSKVLRISKNTLITKLTRKSKFSWIKRKISDEEVLEIRSLKLNGIYMRDEVKRFYPKGHLLSHVLGFVNIDNEGLEGIERSQNNNLKGNFGLVNIMKDAKGREIVANRRVVEKPVDGLDVVLTIDEVVQNITEDELDILCANFSPKNVTAIVMDVRNGNILAMSNRPTFNLNQANKAPLAFRKNVAVVNAYEPGSLFKVISAAAAINEGVVRMNESIYCEHGAYRVGGNTLHDSHPFDNLTFKEVIAKSSNIGFSKVMSRLDSKTFYNYIKQFGFGTRLGVSLAGERRGLVWNYKKWSGYSKSAISMGHEIMVTPLQMSCAISTIANGGRFIYPRIIEKIQTNDKRVIKDYPVKYGKNIIKKQTAKKLTSALESVVSKEGTAEEAFIDGINVAGKTGTAQKIIDGKYSHSKYVSSFYGFLPSRNPLISITIMVDEPHGKLYGGTVAAPSFAVMGERIIDYMMPRSLASIVSKGEEDVA